MTDKKAKDLEATFRKKMEQMEIRAETIHKIYEALDEDPNNVSKNLDLALLLFEQKAYDDVWEPLNKILEIDPKNHEALLLKAKLKKIQKK